MLAFFLANNNFVLEIVLYILLGATGVQVFYYLFFYMRLLFINEKVDTSWSKTPVSVIIAAKNEENNLREFLPEVLNQDYPNFEVIVVNDCSTDGSELLLNEFKAEYKHLYVSTIRQDATFSHGKKLVVSLGIKAAKNETLIFIDADCKPVSRNWLKEVVSSYSNDTEIVLGYGAYAPEKGFLNKLIRYETLFTAVQYLSFAQTGVPYMGVGRNLSYKKELWTKEKGFSSHSHILSGDDDLFVNAVATKKNTKIVVSEDSFTVSVPKKSFSKLVWQKRRHFETGRHYRFFHKFLLGTELFSRFLFYSFAIISLIFIDEKLYVAGVIIFRELLMLLILTFSAKKFKEKGISIFILIFDFLAPLINFYIELTSRLFKKKTAWK